MMNDLKAYLRYYVNSNKRLVKYWFIILFLMMPFFTFNYIGLPLTVFTEDTFYIGFIALGLQPVRRVYPVISIYQFIISSYLYKKSHEG